MTTEITNKELTTTITNMLEHITKVADLVEQVIPDAAVKTGIQECSNKLKEYMDIFSLRMSGIDVLDGDIDINESLDTLTKLIVKECGKTVKECGKVENTMDLDVYKAKSNYVLGLLAFLKK